MELKTLGALKHIKSQFKHRIGNTRSKLQKEMIIGLSVSQFKACFCNV